MNNNEQAAVSQERLQEELKEYEENRRLTPGEKRALRKWVASGHSVQERPDSKYICSHCLPPEYDFIDVYRMDKEIDADTKGMRPKEKEAYLKEYFGCYEPDEEEIRWKEARKNTPPLVRDGYISLSREAFWLWEYICTEGLHEEAAEFLREHKNEETPFEWEGSFPPSSLNDY